VVFLVPVANYPGPHRAGSGVAYPTSGLQATNLPATPFGVPSSSCRASRVCSDPPLPLKSGELSGQFHRTGRLTPLSANHPYGADERRTVAGARERHHREMCGHYGRESEETLWQSWQRRANGHGAPFAVTRALSVRGQRAQASSAVARECASGRTSKMDVAGFLLGSDQANRPRRARFGYLTPNPRPGYKVRPVRL
jgi:hypothetical protein